MVGQVQGFQGCLHLPGLEMAGQVQGGLEILLLLILLLLVLGCFLRDEEGRCSVNEIRY